MPAAAAANDSIEDFHNLDEEATIKGRALAPARRKHSLSIYNKLMKYVDTPMRPKHFYHLKNFDASKQLPMGPVSWRLYASIMRERHFDEFCRMVPSEKTDRDKEFEKMTGGLTENGVKDELMARAFTKKRLLTPIWRIGYKRPLHHPVGQAKHQNNILNSEGNETYFSYDGDWLDGKMHGIGIYQFMDGHRYEGGFREGQMKGHCTVVYPCGAVYQGFFSDNLFHGEGTLVYEDGSKYVGSWKYGKRHGLGEYTLKSGIVYKGDFFAGKPHGRGHLYSPQTMYIYEGTFENGAIRGYGTLTDPQKKKEVRHWAGLDPTRSFSDAIEQLRREKNQDYKAALKSDDDTFAVVRALRLQEYVADLKFQIASDRAEEKQQALLERRRNFLKAREKIKELREAQQAILDTPQIDDFQLKRAERNIYEEEVEEGAEKSDKLQEEEPG